MTTELCILWAVLVCFGAWAFWQLCKVLGRLIGRVLADVFYGSGRPR